MEQYTIIKVLEDYSSVLPEHHHLFSKIAHLYNEQYNYEEAIKYGQKAYQLAPKNIKILLTLATAHDANGNKKRAAFFFEKYIDSDVEHDENSLSKAAWCLQEVQKYRKAIKCYKRLLEVQQSYNFYTSSIYLNLGYCYGRLEENEKAIECSEKALQLTPNDATALLNIGFRYWVMQDLRLAEEYTQRCLDTSSEYDFALMNMGHIWLCQNKYEEALDIYKHSLRAFNNLEKFLYYYEDDRKYFEPYHITNEEYSNIRAILEKYYEEKILP